MSKLKVFLGVAAPVAVVSIITACGGGGSSSSTAARSVSAADVTSNYVDIAYAMYSDSLSTAESLQTAVTALLATPTEDNLELARAAYKAARVPYQQSEILRWDTDITLGSNTGDAGIESVDEWEGQVNAWPLAEGLIDYVDGGDGNNIISGVETIDSAYLMAQNGVDDNDANVATGVHAIEFLLWGQDLNDTEAGSGERPATDYDTGAGCTNGNCDRRAQYLEVATELLVSDLTNMVAEWSPAAVSTDGTLAYNFVNHDDAIAYIAGSMKVMADDELAGARMGSALELGDTEEEHDCFSDLSHVAIYNNFQGIKNAFYGTYSSANGDSTISGASFGTLLKQTDSNTYSTIDAAFTSIEAKMAAIQTLGETADPILKFDQIIGLGEGNEHYDNANAASLELVELGIELDLARQALALAELNTGGGGDGD
ncbi:hypothetical protein A9Q81_08640 [Gammaproteobacteria bacterium 42_54_T18]|mgnify:CR=1 FL=1|nr:hypothetical protein A9Q81_08640 [Gammaproteobacteria bacterium 42_54_T18]